MSCIPYGLSKTNYNLLQIITICCVCVCRKLFSGVAGVAVVLAAAAASMERGGGDVI